MAAHQDSFIERQAQSKRSGPTSTPPGPAKGTARSRQAGSRRWGGGHGWADHQAPHRLRRAWPQPGHAADPWTGTPTPASWSGWWTPCGWPVLVGGANRAALRAHRIPHTIPERDDQKANRARKGARGGRPPRVDRVRYRQRNQIERLMNRRKQFRAVATRYDKLACRYLATVTIADIFIWLRARPDQPRA